MKKYRPCAAAIIINDKGKILIAERNNVNDAWQFPQGGIEKGESDIEAIYREVQEEVSIKSKYLTIIDKKTGYKYKYHSNHRKAGIFTGQEQTYFLMKFNGKKSNINLEKTDHEFKDIKWIKPEKFKIKWVPEFKKKVYKKVFADFFNIELI